MNDKHASVKNRNCVEKIGHFPYTNHMNYYVFGKRSMDKHSYRWPELRNQGWTNGIKPVHPSMCRNAIQMYSIVHSIYVCAYVMSY